MKKYIIYTVLLLLIHTSCSSNDISENNNSNNPNNNNPNTNNDNNGNVSGAWLVPISEVKDGGPGKDGIPSIDRPKFINPSEASFLNDDDLIIGHVYHGESRAYPHKVLDWHEVVNDIIDGNAVTISYCPLTGSALGWKSESDGERTSFGVSGLLYNSNLILYDRRTNSNWSQLRIDCINGKLIGNKPESTKIIETNWKTWKTLYPNTTVLSLDTGFARDYNLYPYGSYKTNQNLFLFTASPTNSALPNKQRVFTIIEENRSKVYQFSDFENGKVFKDTFNEKEFLVVGNGSIINAFELSGEYSNLTFNYTFSNSEAFFTDSEGNEWSVFGKATSGSRKGETLSSSKSFISFWFAAAAFYPNPEIYSGQ